MSLSTLNPYFDHYNQTAEQQFHDDLVVENFQIAGLPAYFLPRDFDSIDEILKEAYQSVFNRAYYMPVILESNGAGYDRMDVLSPFGLQFQAKANFFISKSIFRSLNVPGRDNRPLEGDVLVIGDRANSQAAPVTTGSYMQINHVLQDSIFFPLGNYYVWKCECTLYTASYEKFDTGNEVIDRINTQYGNEAEKALSTNEGLKKKKESLIDFTEKNPFSGM